MQVVYSAAHLRHAPEHEHGTGRMISSFEIPGRAEAIRRSLETGGFELVAPTEHGLGPIDAVHDPAMVRYLERAWREWQTVEGETRELFPDTVLHPALREGMGPPPAPGSPAAELGFWCFETCTPVVEGTYEAARSAVDVALTAADLVSGGERAAYGLCRPPGHHAARAVFGGYCYLNNAAIAAEHLLRRSTGGVAVLDLDYHHGNGTQQIFYGNGDLFYASLHGDPERAYPHFAGFADETGTGRGRGRTLNVPLPKSCSNDRYLTELQPALDAIAAFAPAALVVSLGIDTYEHDPICDLALTTEAYPRVGRAVAQLEVPTVVLQEGGYHVPSLGENVRAWLAGFEDPAARAPSGG